MSIVYLRQELQLRLLEGFNSKYIWEWFEILKDSDNPKSFLLPTQLNFRIASFLSQKAIRVIKYLTNATFSIVVPGCFKQLLIIYIKYLLYIPKISPLRSAVK